MRKDTEGRQEGRRCAALRFSRVTVQFFIDGRGLARPLSSTYSTFNQDTCVGGGEEEEGGGFTGELFTTKNEDIGDFVAVVDFSNTSSRQHEGKRQLSSPVYPSPPCCGVNVSKPVRLSVSFPE